jgi:hypothetical protein
MSWYDTCRSSSGYCKRNEVLVVCCAHGIWCAACACHKVGTAHFVQWVTARSCVLLGDSQWGRRALVTVAIRPRQSHVYRPFSVEVPGSNLGITTAILTAILVRSPYKHVHYCLYITTTAQLKILTLSPFNNILSENSVVKQRDK